MTTATNSPLWLSIRRNLEKATLELLSDHKLEGWRIIFENVSTRAGQCNYTNKTISYSIPFMLHASPEQRMNTIFHEVAHAITGSGHGHDLTWKRRFLRLGGNGERTSEFPASIFTHANYLWIGVCPTCKEVTGAKRAPQTVWGCGKCSKAVPVKNRVFTWSKNHVLTKPDSISAAYAANFLRLEKQF